MGMTLGCHVLVCMHSPCLPGVRVSLVLVIAFPELALRRLIRGQPEGRLQVLLLKGGSCRADALQFRWTSWSSPRGRAFWPWLQQATPHRTLCQEQSSQVQHQERRAAWVPLMQHCQPPRADGQPSLRRSQPASRCGHLWPVPASALSCSPRAPTLIIVVMEPPPGQVHPPRAACTS